MSRGLGDVYKRQVRVCSTLAVVDQAVSAAGVVALVAAGAGDREQPTRP